MTLSVYRFDDTEYRSHIVAFSMENAIAIFDKVMGPELREEAIKIYPIDGSTVLLISQDGSAPFTEHSADEWIAIDPRERFL